MKFLEVDRESFDDPEYIFQCPGCGGLHGVWVNIFHTNGSRWYFNGDVDKPIINPSLLVRGENKDGPTVCHSFIKDGMIQFLSDCTHELAGKTVEIEDF